MGYRLAVYSRTGELLGELRPESWTAKWGLGRTNTLGLTLRRDDPMVEACSDVARAVVVLSEELPGGATPTRLAAEIVTRRRGSGSTVDVSALSPEWRWNRIVAGNTAGAGWAAWSTPNNWIAPMGPTTDWVDPGPGPIDRVEAAARIVAAASYLSEEGISGRSGASGGIGKPMHWDALGLARPPVTGITYAEDGSGFVALSHDPGIRLGVYTNCGGVVNTIPADLWRKTVQQLIDELAAGLDGFEWWMSYTDAPQIGGAGGIGPIWGSGYRDPAGREYNYAEIAVGTGGGTPPVTSSGADRPAAWAKWNAAAARGIPRPHFAFEYGAGAANVDEWDEVVDATELTTSAVAPPPGGVPAEVAGRVDGSVQAAYAYAYEAARKYGLLDRVVNADVASLPMRQQLANETLEVAARPRQTVTIKPGDREAGAPWLHVDYDVGDRVRFVAWERSKTVDVATGLESAGEPVAVLDAYLRVYAAELTGDKDGGVSASVTVVDDG